MRKQISVKCDQIPQRWAHIFLVKGLKVVCPSPQQHVLFLRMQHGAQLAVSQSPGSSRANPMLAGQEIWQHIFKLNV